MNKTIIFMSLFLLTLAPALVLGATPVYQGGFSLTSNNISGALPEQFRDGSQFAFWGDYIAIETPYNVNQQSMRLLGEIYNWKTGNNVFGVTLDDLINCGSGMNGIGKDSVKYEAGNVYFGRSVTCGVQRFGRTAIYDVTSIGFIEQRYYGGHAFSNNYVNEQFRILSSNGATTDFLITGFAYHVNATGGLEPLLYNFIPPEPFPKTGIPVDDDNGYFVDDDGLDIYSYNPSGEMNNNVLVGSLEPLSGVIVDWNRNFLNPEFVSSNGNIMLVGGSDYDDFRTSSLEIGNFTPMFFFERDNIIGIKDNEFWSADVTDTGNIIETNTGVEVNADWVKREDDNKIITYNSTTREFRVYEVPLPTFISEPELALDNPPSIDLNFLGTDNNGRFVFTSTFTDIEGGRLYYALNTLKFPEEINLSDVSWELDFDTELDLAFVDTGVTPNITTNTGWSEFDLDGALYVGGVTDTIIDLQDVSVADSPLVNFSASFVAEPDFPNGVVNSSVSLKDANGNYFLHLIFTEDNSNYLVNISYWNGATFLPLAINSATLGGNDFFTLGADLNFDTDEITITIFDRFGGTHVNAVTIDGLQSFSSLGEAIFNNVCGGCYDFYLDYVHWTYPAEEQFPPYNIFDTIQAGEFSTKALRNNNVQNYGYYEATLYGTDDANGLDYYDTSTTIAFQYTEDTQTLSEIEIAQILADIEAGLFIGDGFTSPDFIEGDLVTDTFFGLLDEWNIKSTASKFFAGLVIILLFIGVGGWMGVQLKSPIVSTIGAGIGGIGAIFLVTYWGLFPAWVSFTIVLIVVGGISNMVRNSLTGRGGS